MRAKGLITRSQSSSGFSLIELLVVLFIIGLLIASVSLTVSIGDDPEEQLQREALRLLDFSRLAEDRAVLTGEPIGLRLMAPDTDQSWRYEWLRYRGGQWVEAQEPFEAGQFPDNIELTLEVEGEQVDFTRVRASRRSDNEEDETLPSLVFYPGGEVTVFRLTLFDAQEVDQQQVLSSERVGRVELLEGDEAMLQ